MWSQFAFCILLVMTVSATSKFDTTCNDLKCHNGKMCVMAVEPCGESNEICGLYPTCTEQTDAGSGVKSLSSESVDDPIENLAKSRQRRFFGKWFRSGKRLSNFGFRHLYKHLNRHKGEE